MDILGRWKPRLICELDHRVRQAQIGNKAANILRLGRMGMKTPKTFVLSGNAYQRYSRDDVAIVDELRAELREILKADRAYAVRSSANLEDSDAHSFAGQFKTMLDVQGPDGVLQAVWAVWASAATPQVRSYLSRRSLDESALNMAVIVQEMVKPVFSGVAFSRNPLTGLRETVVEAVAGKGTLLVQEGVTPERWIYHGDKFTSRPIKEQIPQQVIEQVVVGVRKAARKTQKNIDLEWVYDGDDLYWVQMREITGLENIRIYSNSISREMLAGMIKPLIWSINIPLVGGIWIRLLNEAIGITHLTAHDLVRAFHYRAYFNMGLLGEVFEEIGFPAESLEIMWGLSAEEQPKPEKTGGRVKMMPRGMPPMGKMLRRLPRAGRFFWKMWNLLGCLQKTLAELEADFRAMDAGEIGELPPKTLLEQVDRLYLRNQEAAYLNVVVPLSMYLYSTLLRKQLQRLGVDFTVLDFQQDEPEFLRYNPNFSLAELRKTYSRLSPDAQRALETASCDEINGLEGIDDFKVGFQKLLNDFGHLSDNGNDFSSVPWRENADSILRLVIDFPAEEKESFTNGSKQNAKVPFQALKLPAARRWMLRGLYDRARQFQLYREQISYIYTLGYGLFRVIFLALAERFRERGWIEARDEIFYLTLDELRSAVENDAGERLHETACTRRREMEAVRDIHLPQVIIGDQPPVIEKGDGRVLRGTATSRGYSSGPVRVVNGLNDFSKVQPGDVLVIPFSDVSWTPLFARACAVIAESGGMLSHSSIVAREFGIPAVVSVLGATRLKDGTVVSIDGFKGEVILHEGGDLVCSECE